MRTLFRMFVTFVAAVLIMTLNTGCKKKSVDYNIVSSQKILSIETTDDTAWELYGDSAVFILNSGQINTTGENLLVYLDVFGSAKMGIDCDSVIPEGFVTIPPNEQYAKILVKGVRRNGVVEETKTIELTITGCSNDAYDISQQNQAGIIILDGDGPTVKDIDGNIYHSVKIGTQTWMVENLRTSRYRNGDVVTKSWFYDNNPSNGNTYGRLYDWYAANDSRGLAPAGWHIPSEIDWKYLTSYLGGEKSAGKKMKTKSGWYKNGNGTNESGFSALPSGEHNFQKGVPEFHLLGSHATFWSSKSTTTQTTDEYFLTFKNNHFSKLGTEKLYGYSIRCIMD